MLWLRISGNLWFLPTVMTGLAIALSVLTIIIDDWLIASGQARELWFVFGVGAEGVRGVLSSIAGSIITVTGVVFSITVVALQLASTQFTPRVLRTFIEDRANQLVLGVFIGTFTYALLILRFVRSESDRVGAFVPSVSVTVAMALAIVSVGCLIYFINHIAYSISASAVIDRLTRDAVATAKRAFPREIGEPAVDEGPMSEQAPHGEPVLVRANDKGYLQIVQEDALLRLPSETALVIRMEGQIGHFFNSGDVLASVWMLGGPVPDRLARKVRAAFVLGVEPTGPQDVVLGVTRLVDVAVKALSPGINDPTTASMCIDGIGEVLIVLGSRAAPHRVRVADDGRVRLIGQRPSYEEVVALAFSQIRHYGGADAAIVLKLLETIERIGSRVPVKRRASLVQEASHVARAAEEHSRDPDDRARVRRAAERVATGLASPGISPPPAP
jgi:uncharacterized membrane protein